MKRFDFTKKSKIPATWSLPSGVWPENRTSCTQKCCLAMMTQNRNTGLQLLRPSIPVDLTENPENSAGHFQNATLRPILKLQNELLLQLFRHYLHKSKGVFFQLARPEQLAFIANSIRRDQHFRNFLVGIVVGHFTEAEWAVFAPQEQELSRRITDLLIQRLSDQVECFLPL